MRAVHVGVAMLGFVALTTLVSTPTSVHTTGMMLQAATFWKCPVLALRHEFHAGSGYMGQEVPSRWASAGLLHAHPSSTIVMLLVPTARGGHAG